jgi:hypothetical protein
VANVLNANESIHLIWSLIRDHLPLFFLDSSNIFPSKQIFPSNSSSHRISSLKNSDPPAVTAETDSELVLACSAPHKNPGSCCRRMRSCRRCLRIGEEPPAPPVGGTPAMKCGNAAAAAPSLRSRCRRGDTAAPVRTVKISSCDCGEGGRPWTV